MLSYEHQVVEDQNGPVCHAQQAQCECADGGGGDIFYVFWPEGANHFHTACAQCQQHYCLFNLCAIPLLPPPPEPIE